MLLTGLRAARNTNGSQVVAPIAAAMTAMTASRRSGSSAALNPERRHRDPASSSAISDIVNAVKASNSRVPGGREAQE